MCGEPVLQQSFNLTIMVLWDVCTRPRVCNGFRWSIPSQRSASGLAPPGRLAANLLTQRQTSSIFFWRGFPPLKKTKGLGTHPARVWADGGTCCSIATGPLVYRLEREILILESPVRLWGGSRTILKKGLFTTPDGGGVSDTGNRAAQETPWLLR